MKSVLGLGLLLFYFCINVLGDSATSYSNLEQTFGLPHNGIIGNNELDSSSDGWDNVHNHKYYDVPSYNYSYGVQDPQTGDNKDQWEIRDGDAVRGSYSFIEADGSKRIVDYTADDKNGFKAVVRNIPPEVYQNPVEELIDATQLPANKLFLSTTRPSVDIGYSTPAPVIREDLPSKTPVVEYGFSAPVPAVELQYNPELATNNQQYPTPEPAEKWHYSVPESINELSVSGDQPLEIVQHSTISPNIELNFPSQSTVISSTNIPTAEPSPVVQISPGINNNYVPNYHNNNAAPIYTDRHNVMNRPNVESHYPSSEPIHDLSFTNNHPLEILQHSTNSPDLDLKYPSQSSILAINRPTHLPPRTVKISTGIQPNNVPNYNSNNASPLYPKRYNVINRPSLFAPRKPQPLFALKRIVYYT